MQEVFLIWSAVYNVRGDIYIVIEIILWGSVVVSAVHQIFFIFGSCKNFASPHFHLDVAT